MTTEPKPYTVPMLREWAQEFSELADWWGAKGPGVVWRAQAAAFDALADGIEACEAELKPGKDWTISEVLKGRAAGCEYIGRILRGEKPK